MPRDPDAPMFLGSPPDWALMSEKPVWQSIYDLVGAPLRMAILPDHLSERCHLTSLRAERLRVVLGEVQGRLLDIGAGDNMLVRLHQANYPDNAEVSASIGLDVFDWGGDCIIIEDCRALPFDNCSFDTVSFVACLNHIPERAEALREAYRVLRPGGKLVLTMIGRLVGSVGHAIWWYSEDKHRDHQKDELMGMSSGEIVSLIRKAGFDNISRRVFLYGLNSLYVADRSHRWGLSQI